MKKILFSLVALVCSMSMNAQVMKIYKGEVLVATYTADQADRVVYEEAPAVVNVTSVTLDKTTAEIDVDGTVTLTATVNPTDASDKTIEWTTNDETIATVDQTGKVTGVAAGTVTITATAKDGSGKTATCTITVKSTSGGQSNTFSLGEEGDLGYDEVDW